MNNFKIYETTLDGLEEIITKMKTVEDGDMDLGSLFVQRPSFYIEDDTVSKVGHIYVFGPLLRVASEFVKKTGVTTYSQIIEELKMAESTGCDYVILHMDSPGGDSMGSLEACEAVRTFAKPVYGLVEGYCASACYKIASACTEIYSTVSGEIGSIGAIIAFDNTKAMMNGMGITRNIFTNSDAKYKSLGQDYGDLSDEESKKVQDKVEQSGLRFQQYVKQNRPEVLEQSFNGDIFYSKDALALGLIDAVIS